MTKEGYTHIIVPKELHAILKREAETRGVSIANYITEVLASVQQVGALMFSEMSINTSEKASEGLKVKINGPDAIRTHDLRLVKATSFQLDHGPSSLSRLI